MCPTPLSLGLRKITSPLPKLFRMTKFKIFSYIALVQAMLATAGSLFFSEVWHLPPCVLCWYQRAMMYSLVLVLAVGILRKDRNLPYYVLPLSTVGGVVAVVHNLLYFGVIPQATVPCQLGISCTTRFFEWFGFITIPLLSLGAFIVITGCMFLLWRSRK